MKINPRKITRIECFDSIDPIEIVLSDRNRLPALVQPLHILQTGIDSPGSVPRRSTPIRELATDLGWLGLFAVVAGGGSAVAAQGAIALSVAALPTLFGQLGMIGRLRRLIVGHTHEAGHGVVTKFYLEKGLSKKAAHRITEAILDAGSILTLTLNGQDYRREHNRHHRPLMLGTHFDPDGKVLKDWGLWPDQVDSLKKALWRTALSPIWHYRFLKDRLRSNLGRGKPYRRVLAALWLSTLCVSAFVLPFAVWVAAGLIPFGPGLHVASLMQVVTEHTYGHKDGARDINELAARTWERIPYNPMPSAAPTRDPMGWARWCMKMCIRVAERLAILDSTMIAHGYHHLAWPIGRPFDEWWLTSHKYLEAKKDGVLPEGADARIVWGVGGALDRQAEHFRAAGSGQIR